MHKTNDFFYSIMAFSYTKYFVCSYTVEVVFTLSYLVASIFGSAYNTNVTYLRRDNSSFIPHLIRKPTYVT